MRASLGAKAAAQFSALWARHINAVVKFSVAVADRDDQGQAAARAEIDTFPAGLGRLLPQVGRGKVAAQTVVQAMKEHDEQLLQQVTAYAAHDYARSHELGYDGYEHMFEIADWLADALQGHAAGVSPRGGAATGGRGLATR
jgi:hypothetical protein